MSTKGYRGHDAPNPRRIFISGQKRGVFGVIKRELRRRSAIEPVIGHLKAEGHLGRCYLKGRAGDAANAILSAVGYNFRRIPAWLRALLPQILIRGPAPLDQPINAQPCTMVKLTMEREITLNNWTRKDRGSNPGHTWP